jgi:hypothetical protein
VTDVPIGSLPMVTRAGRDLLGARTITVSYRTMPPGTETKLTRR